jgi:hypothetical protein
MLGKTPPRFAALVRDAARAFAAAAVCGVLACLGVLGAVGGDIVELALCFGATGTVLAAAALCLAALTASLPVRPRPRAVRAIASIAGAALGFCLCAVVLAANVCDDDMYPMCACLGAVGVVAAFIVPPTVLAVAVSRWQD